MSHRCQQDLSRSLDADLSAIPPSPVRVLARLGPGQRIVLLLALGLGSGLSPRAPGTVGTLAAVPCYVLLARLPTAAYLLTVVIAFALGVWLCGQANRWLGGHDHAAIVWDEWVGLWVTLIAVPSGGLWLVIGFVLFRLFDIAKPWPVNLADRRVAGGVGIMLDDLLAALYAWALLQLLVRVF